VEATSAFEAMEKMVQGKKLSKKINYEVLKDLNPSAFKPDTVEFTQVPMIKIIIIITVIIIIEKALILNFVERHILHRNHFC